MQYPRAISAYVGARIAQRRARHRITQQQLVERCCALGLPITPYTLSTIERGRPNSPVRRPLTVDELIVIAVALGVRPSALLPLTDEGQPLADVLAQLTSRPDKEN